MSETALPPRDDPGGEAAGLDSPLRESVGSVKETRDELAPDASVVHTYLLYTLSVPERAVRSSLGLVGGAAHEAASLLLPRAFRDSKTYEVLIQQTLDFMVEDVAGVERKKLAGEAAPGVDNFVARKAVGSFVQTARALTFHVSPLTVLAIVSDIAYGSTAYLKELAAELEKQGLIDDSSTIHHVDDLLAAVAETSAHSASTLDTPPISLDGLRDTVAKTRSSLGKIDPRKVIPQAEIKRMWDEMHQIADRQDVGLLTVSTTMTMHTLDKVAGAGRGAVASVRVAGNLFDRHVIDHYATALQDVRQRGVYSVLAETSGPYVRAVWVNFAGDRETITEGMLSGKLIARAWQSTRAWFGRKGAVAPAQPAVDDAGGPNQP